MFPSGYALSEFDCSLVSGLALKADMHLTWFSLRKLRVWLREFGIYLQSERCMRAEMEAELPFHFISEKVPMCDKSGHVILCAMVAVPDLTGLVLHYIDEYDRTDQLIWHDGAIPDGTIVVKIGGDHGGGTFKMAFQIANHRHPHSLQNTIPFLVLEAKDSPANLAAALQPYQEQVKLLSSMQHNQYTLRVVLFGDYEFQTHNYGLSGSSGVHPCLHCTATKKDFQLTTPERTGTAEVRTLTTLAEHHAEFLASGGISANAKKYFNVVRPCILPVPIEDACIPALHLDLGIFPYLYDCMLADTRSLDMQLAQSSYPGDADSSPDFSALARVYSDIRQKELELNDVSGTINDTLNQLTYNAMHLQQVTTAGAEVRVQSTIGELNLRHRLLAEQQQLLQTGLTTLQEEVSNRATVKDGPCVLSYERVLQRYHVCRQQYHGGAFVGNHVHRILQHVDDLVDAPRLIIASHFPDECSISAHANTLASRYRDLFIQFSSCRKIYMSSSLISEEQLDQLSVHTTTFLATVRREVTSRKLGNITPKLHLLEEHAAPQIRHFGCGLGLLGEQGGEALHAAFNELTRRHCRIPCPVKRLLTTTRQHYITTIPNLADKTPAKKRRTSQ